MAVTATNQADDATGTVALTLVATDDATAETRLPVRATINPIDAHGTSTAVIDWDTAGVLPGTYTLTVAASAAGDTDDANNAISSTIKLVNAIDLVAVSPKTVSAIVGHPIDFAVRVKNLGNNELKNVTANLFVANGATPIARAAIGAITAGSTAATTLTWNTEGQDVDNHPLAIYISADGQEGDDNDIQWVTVHLRNPIALTATADTAASLRVIGHLITVEASVTNAGLSAVPGVEVSLYASDPTRAVDIQTIAPLAPGATEMVRLVWNTTGVAAGDHTLAVVAALPGYSADNDDRANIVVTLAKPAIGVAFVGPMTAPAAIAIGKTLTATAQLANHGDAPASAVVGLYLDGATEPVATTNTAVIDPGSTVGVSVEWNAVGPATLAGKYRLRLTADLRADTNPADNTITSSVTIFPSAFDNPDSSAGCVDDVAVYTAIRDPNGSLADPAHYDRNATLYVDYQIYNYSCETDVEVNVDLKAKETEVSIPDDTDNYCRTECLVPAGAKVATAALWPLSNVPLATDETVQTTETVETMISVTSPPDFADANAANDTAMANQRINIVLDKDITLYVGEAEVSKRQLRDDLNQPEFGLVDLALLSADLQTLTLAHDATAVMVSAAASNRGREPEPAAIRVARLPSEVSESPVVLHTETMMIKPGPKPTTTTFAAPAEHLDTGSHTVQVELTAVNNQTASDDAPRFAVKRLPAPVSATIVSIGADPAESATQGEPVAIHVTARNDGSTAVKVPIQLTFPSPDKQPELKSPRILPGETAVASFTWRTRNYDPGEHILRADLMLENNLTVGDTSGELRFQLNAPVTTATILDISTSLAAPVAGDAVTITVSVRNDGPIAASIPVTLHFPDADKQPETRNPRAPPGATATATFTWRTGNTLPGVHHFQVAVPSLTEPERGFTVELLPAPVSATIVGIGADPAQSATQGEPVAIHVTARNDGSTAVKVPIQLTFPSPDKQPELKSPRILPGETAVASFTWRTRNYDPGEHILRADLMLENNLTVGDTSGELRFQLNAPVTTATILDISTSLAAPVAGDAVTITVSVRNDGPVAASIPVTLHFPDADKQPETRNPRAPPGATATATFTWRTGNTLPGVHHFQVAVPSLTEPERGFTVELLPAPVSATIVGFSADPAATATQGEPVAIHVTARNDGSTAVKVPIQLTFPSPDKQPELKSPRILPGETAVASFTWRTRNYDPWRAHSARRPYAGKQPYRWRYVGGTALPAQRSRHHRHHPGHLDIPRSPSSRGRGDHYRLGSQRRSHRRQHSGNPALPRRRQAARNPQPQSASGSNGHRHLHLAHRQHLARRAPLSGCCPLPYRTGAGIHRGAAAGSGQRRHRWHRRRPGTERHARHVGGGLGRGTQRRRGLHPRCRATRFPFRQQKAGAQVSLYPTRGDGARNLHLENSQLRRRTA